MAWVLTDECDSLLFSCLDAVGRGQPFDICQARVGKGLWLRRPAGCGPCSSTTSRDMQMGLLVYFLHFKRADLLRELADRCMHSFGKMGTETKPWENRVYYTPGLFVLLLACYFYVSNRPKLAKALTYIPQVYSVAPGYTSHLTLLHIYLNRRIRGKLVGLEYRALWEIEKHMQSSPLVHALLGRGSLALQKLEARWPGGLPAPKTAWSEPWVLQRSDGDPGLKPDLGANPLSYHGDGDYLFARHAIGLFCR